MADNTDTVSVKLRWLRQKQFSRDGAQAGKTVRNVGNETKRATKHASKWNRVLNRGNGYLAGGVRAGVKYAAGIAAIGGAAQSLKTTEDFAKGVLTLNKMFKMGVDDASRWAAALQARDLNASAFTVALNKNSKMVESAAKKGGMARDTFHELGLTMDDVSRGRGDLNWLLLKEVERLDGIKSATKRATIAQSLWGRSYVKLRPLLGSGSKNLKEQLSLADKYGVTLNGKTVKSVNDLISAQREAKYATLGLQLAVGQYLVPAVTKVTRVITNLLAKIRNGDGDWKRMRDTVRDVVRWFKEHRNVTKALVITLGSMFIAVKVGMWISKLVTVLKGAAIATRLVGIALKVAFLTNPIVLAITAIVVAVVLAYKKIGWFRKGVQSLWGFLKKAPSGLWNWLTEGLTNVVNWVIKKINWVIRAYNKVADLPLNPMPHVSELGLVGGDSNSTPGRATMPNGKALPGLAEGGVVRRMGAALVGERGPELVTLNRGAQVTPLPAGAGGVPDVYVYLDSTPIMAKVVTRAKNEARRRGRGA